jgi:hypothetical protein
MYVGSVAEMDDLIGKIKAAKKVEKGLVVFMFRNEDAEEGQPLFTLYVDVSSDDRGPKKRKPIEDDDEDADEDEDSDEKDDEVPF